VFKNTISIIFSSFFSLSKSIILTLESTFSHALSPNKPQNSVINAILHKLNWIIIFGGIGVWTWASHLWGRRSTIWTSAALFGVGCIWDRVLWTIHLELALNCDPPELCLLSS
jgi:hypothetical protein